MSSYDIDEKLNVDAYWKKKIRPLFIKGCFNNAQMIYEYDKIKNTHPNGIVSNFYEGNDKEIFEQICILNFFKEYMDGEFSSDVSVKSMCKALMEKLAEQRNLRCISSWDMLSEIERLLCTQNILISSVLLFEYFEDMTEFHDWTSPLNHYFAWFMSDEYAFNTPSYFSRLYIKQIACKKILDIYRSYPEYKMIIELFEQSGAKGIQFLKPETDEMAKMKEILLLIDQCGEVWEIHPELICQKIKRYYYVKEITLLDLLNNMLNVYDKKTASVDEAIDFIMFTIYVRAGRERLEGIYKRY